MLKFYDKAMRPLYYLVIATGIFLAILDWRNEVGIWLVFISSIRHLALLKAMVALLAALFANWCPILVAFFLMAILRPNLILYERGVKRKGPTDIYFKEWTWVTLHGVEIKPSKNGKWQILIFRVGRFEKRESPMDAADLKRAVDYIVTKMPPEKLGVGFEIYKS